MKNNKKWWMVVAIIILLLIVLFLPVFSCNQIAGPNPGSSGPYACQSLFDLIINGDTYAQ